MKTLSIRLRVQIPCSSRSRLFSVGKRKHASRFLNMFGLDRMFKASRKLPVQEFRGHFNNQMKAHKNLCWPQPILELPEVFHSRFLLAGDGRWERGW